MSNNEQAMYEVLKRRGTLPNLSFPEYAEAARAVVATIPEEAITPIEELLTRLETEIAKRRKPWADLNILRGSK